MAGWARGNLSDVDDDEVRAAILTDEEARVKTELWMAANRDYLESLEGKGVGLGHARAWQVDLCIGATARREEAAAWGERCRQGRGPQGACSFPPSRLGTSADGGRACASQKRRRQHKDARGAEPVATAAEAARQVLAQRKISKKINYAVLEGLFDGGDAGSAVKPE
jgi:transcription factor IIIB 90 kDa subunit